MKDLYLLLDISWGGELLQTYDLKELVNVLCVNTEDELVIKSIDYKDYSIKFVVDMYNEIIAVDVSGVFDIFYVCGINFSEIDSFIKSLDKK